MQKLIIDKFRGKYEKFSNFYPVLIDYKGIRFPSVEHAYVASKTTDTQFWLMIASLGPREAGKAKRLGRKVIMRRDWEEVRLDLMKEFIFQKFNWKVFKEFLLNTGNADIIEGNYWHDNFWGNCSCEQCIHIPGQNHLGKIIMEVRGLL